MKETEIITGVSALLFYALCWFTHQPTQWMWALGIAMPWLSLVAGILVSFATSKEASWKYCYLLSTIIYVVFVSVKKMDFLSQVPYMASCICFIACSALSTMSKRLKTSEDETKHLKERKETLSRQVQSLKAELASTKGET